MFVVKEKLFVWDPKEDTTINQWLSYIHNTVPEQFNTNIRECAAHLTEDCVLKPRVTGQLCTDCFYKVEQFQLCKNSLVLLTRPVSTSLL